MCIKRIYWNSITTITYDLHLGEMMSDHVTGQLLRWKMILIPKKHLLGNMSHRQYESIESLRLSIADVRFLLLGVGGGGNSTNPDVVVSF
jgi:hypothetical protein